jgi:BA14K-like protein
MRFMKPTAAALALAIGALSFSGVAEARNRHYHNNNNGGAAVAGIFGFAAGALVAGALSQPRYPSNYYYYQPAPVYVAPPPPVVYRPYQPRYQPAPVYYAGPQPWSPQWYSYCDARYRSFNPSTGYFLGYDGQYHFCR